MARGNSVKKLMVEALCALTKGNKVWFTRAAVAQYLQSQNMNRGTTLNPTRKGALKKLAIDGVLEEEVVPGDTRGTLRYKLVDTSSC